MQHDATLGETGGHRQDETVGGRANSLGGKGVFTLATGGINSGCCNKGSDDAGGGGGAQGGGKNVTPMKRKGGREKATNISDAYDGRMESAPSHSVIEREEENGILLSNKY